VEVPIKITPPLKRGRASQHKDASIKCTKTTRKTSFSKKVNTSQPKIDGHQVNVINPWSNPHVHTIEQTRGSEDLNSLVLGNHYEFHGVQEISINYCSFGELLDRTTTFVNSCFSTMVTKLLNDPDPKTMVECNARTGSNGRKQSRKNLTHWEKERYFII
jgi:hypothetical protein